MQAIAKSDVAQAVLIFFLLLVVFTVLHAGVGWPTPSDGWPLAILVSAVAALVPIIPRYLSLIGRSLTSVEAFGVKVNFASAISASRVSASTEILVQRATPTPEPTSSLGEMEEAAKDASDQTVFIIDLKDGREWYWSRLFALAGMASITGNPKVIVLIGQRATRPRRFIGAIDPRDLVAAFRQMDERYTAAWNSAQVELRNARLGNGLYAPYHQQIGDPIIMRILVDHMRDPKRAVGKGPLEPVTPDTSTWITPIDADKQLDPWLERQSVELADDDRKQLMVALASDEDIVVATRAGEYSGVVDVRQIERQVLRQLVSGARSDTA